MRLVDADFEEKHYLSMIDNSTPDASENNRKTALAIVKAFRLASTVEERKTGRWIDTGSGQECSVCGEIQYGYDNGRNFCPNCGADMRGVIRNDISRPDKRRRPQD